MSDQRTAAVTWRQLAYLADLHHCAHASGVAQSEHIYARTNAGQRFGRWAGYLWYSYAHIHMHALCMQQREPACAFQKCSIGSISEFAK